MSSKKTCLLQESTQLTLLFLSAQNLTQWADQSKSQRTKWQVVTECCRVLQSVAKYYRLLKSIAEYCRVLQSITEYYREYYRVWQSMAEYGRVLQSIREYYKVLQRQNERTYLDQFLG